MNALRELKAVILMHDLAEREAALEAWTNRWVMSGEAAYLVDSEYLLYAREPASYLTRARAKLRRRLAEEMPVSETSENHPGLTILRTRVLCLKPE